MVETLREDLLGCRLELEVDPYNKETIQRLADGRKIMGKFALYIIEKSYEQQEECSYESIILASRPELN